MNAEVDKSTQGVLLDLFELDLTQFGGGIFYFCNQQNENGGNVFWRGFEYQAYPIQIEGAALTNEGASNRPKLTVSNAEGLVVGLAEQYDLLVGAKVVRRQVLEKFLDAANFVNGNPSADPTQEFVTLYTIGQMTSLDRYTATFTLNLPVETDDALVPARLIIANVCSWEFRGDGCGYDGFAIMDQFGNPTTDMAKSGCPGRLKDCKAHFGKTAVLPFGGFPSVDRVG